MCVWGGGFRESSGNGARHTTTLCHACWGGDREGGSFSSSPSSSSVSFWLSEVQPAVHDRRLTADQCYMMTATLLFADT